MNLSKFITKASALGMFFFALPVLAATTATLSPSAINVGPGAKFNVIVSVNPQGTANYVEKLELTYSTDILEVSEFVFGPKWIALPQPGYDSIDNTKGVMIKSGGYPGGLTTTTMFGTATFTAKKAGSGMIRIGGNSLAYEVSSQSAITGNSIAVTVTVPANSGATVKPIGTDTGQTKQGAGGGQDSASATASDTELGTSTIDLTAGQVAEVSDAVSAENAKKLRWMLGILLLALVLYGVYALGKKQKGI